MRASLLRNTSLITVQEKLARGKRPRANFGHPWGAEEKAATTSGRGDSEGGARAHSLGGISATLYLLPGEGEAAVGPRTTRSRCFLFARGVHLGGKVCRSLSREEVGGGKKTLSLFFGDRKGK